MKLGFILRDRGHIHTPISILMAPCLSISCFWIRLKLKLRSQFEWTFEIQHNRLFTRFDNIHSIFTRFLIQRKPFFLINSDTKKKLSELPQHFQFDHLRSIFSKTRNFSRRSDVVFKIEAPNRLGECFFFCILPDTSGFADRI